MAAKTRHNRITAPTAEARAPFAAAYTRRYSGPGREVSPA